MNTLYLTAEEKKLFAALPADLRDGWEVMEERQRSYESPEALAMRAEITPLKRHPAVKKLFATIQAGNNLEKLALPALSEEDLGEFYFTIGARGMSLFIAAVLRQAQEEEDLMSLASLGEMRHKLLETNASISYV